MGTFLCPRVTLTKKMPPHEAACIAIFTRGHDGAVPTLHPFSPQVIEKLPLFQQPKHFANDFATRAKRILPDGFFFFRNHQK